MQTNTHIESLLLNCAWGAHLKTGLYEGGLSTALQAASKGIAESLREIIPCGRDPVPEGGVESWG